jgi:hypothetical protein
VVVVTDLQMKERQVPKRASGYSQHATAHSQSAHWSLDRHGAGLKGETPTSLRTLLRVKAVNDASRDAVPSETPLDGRQSTTASSGERVTQVLLLVTVQLVVHEKTLSLPYGKTPRTVFFPISVKHIL